MQLFLTDGLKEYHMHRGSSFSWCFNGVRELARFALELDCP